MFGFSINQKRSINLDSGDMALAEELLRRVPTLNRCIGCGGCTATCSAGELTDFNFRKLHTIIRRGESAQVKDQITKCMLCGKCILVCPRGVNTRNVVVTLYELLK